ncbi:hypothetical protein B0H19DRAFT_1250709 [Mycena capillaripes]|nr:hypothetical protein B0H19DRAFT_1250709 [Mycena capillaripes]
MIARFFVHHPCSRPAPPISLLPTPLNLLDITGPPCARCPPLPPRPPLPLPAAPAAPAARRSRCPAAPAVPAARRSRCPPCAGHPCIRLRTRGTSPGLAPSLSRPSWLHRPALRPPRPLPAAPAARHAWGIPLRTGGTSPRPAPTSPALLGSTGPPCAHRARCPPLPPLGMHGASHYAPGAPHLDQRPVSPALLDATGPPCAHRTRCPPLPPPGMRGPLSHPIAHRGHLTWTGAQPLPPFLAPPARPAPAAPPACRPAAQHTRGTLAPHCAPAPSLSRPSGATGLPCARRSRPAFVPLFSGR